MDDKSFNIRVPKKWARVAMIVGVTALIVAPLTAIASHSFTDVPDSNTFHSDIAWLADAGVTKGCNPPDNTEFCPDDDVTRGQMAAFMNRFAGYIGATDGTPAQADNADTLDGMHSAAFAEVPIVTRLHYSGSNTDNSIGGGYEEMRSVGTFTKERDDSAIMLDWIGHGQVDGTFCEFQLRVDGSKDNGSSSTSFELASGGSAVQYVADSPINVRALFPDLSAGDHTVSIWVRGNAASCTLNRGNFGQTVLVEEFSRSVGSGGTFSTQGDTSQQGGQD